VGFLHAVVPRAPAPVPVAANNVPLSWVEHREKSHRVLLMAPVLSMLPLPLERTWRGQRQHQVTLGVRSRGDVSFTGCLGAGGQSCPGVRSSPWPARLGRDPRTAHSCDGACRELNTSYLTPSQRVWESTLPCLFPFSSPAQESLFPGVGDNCLANNSSLGSRESVVFK